MTLQEQVLNQIPKKKEDLIQSQINNAKSILLRNNLKLTAYTLKSISINKIIPSQNNEDYVNESSKYDVDIFLDVKKGLIDLNTLRLETFRPIAINKNTMKIIDGNHRHYALKTAGETNAYVLLCKTQSI
jgi:hypothetical protein